MQKVEILLDGPEAKKCAELINDLAHATMQHFNVAAVNIYCGRAPVKKGLGELRIPNFFARKDMPKDQEKGKEEEEQVYG
ncbi:hypothetical protein D5278_13820 [bacterium 1XD21-13]|nr:hypothetical protein [bacterium 1XD21-13]